MPTYLTQRSLRFLLLCVMLLVPLFLVLRIVYQTLPIGLSFRHSAAHWDMLDRFDESDGATPLRNILQNGSTSYVCNDMNDQQGTANNCQLADGNLLTRLGDGGGSNFENILRNQMKHSFQTSLPTSLRFSATPATPQLQCGWNSNCGRKATTLSQAGTATATAATAAAREVLHCPSPVPTKVVLFSYNKADNNPYHFIFLHLLPLYHITNILMPGHGIDGGRDGISGHGVLHKVHHKKNDKKNDKNNRAPHTNKSPLLHIVFFLYVSPTSTPPPTRIVDLFLVLADEIVISTDVPTPWCFHDNVLVSVTYIRLQLKDLRKLRLTFSNKQLLQQQLLQTTTIANNNYYNNN